MFLVLQQQLQPLKVTKGNMWSTAIKDPVIISVNPDRDNIFLESKQRPATGEDKLHPILESLCR
jgi:hypothetical protein